MLNNYLPEDLINIVDEYIKNTKYDMLVYEIEKTVVHRIYYKLMNDYSLHTFNSQSHSELSINCLNKLINDGGGAKALFYLKYYNRRRKQNIKTCFQDLKKYI